jgi:predicted  nucleic acid-binding Zn-ribbon protein
METREPLDAAVSEVDEHRSVLAAEMDRMRRTLTEAEAVIAAEAKQEREARDAIAAGIDPALVKEYERCRNQAQGVGVARLVGNTCQGCHLTIPATEVERIKKSAGSPLAFCDNCGAILVP